MERHKKENELKTLDNLYREKMRLFTEEGDKVEKWRYSRWDNMHWVPVEKPQFIGWEASITLSDTASHRSDAYILFKALDLTGLSKPRFFKNLSTVALIRRSHKVYDTLLSLHREEVRRKLRKDQHWYNGFPEGIYDVKGNRITVETYDKLEPKERKYFEKRSKTYPSTHYREEWTEYWYVIGGLFPMRDLRVKLDTAYSTHRGIPKADEISREKEITNIFDRTHYYTKRWGKDYWNSRWEEKYILRTHRKAYKVAAKVALQVNDPDDVADVYDQTWAKRIKRWN